MSTRQVSNILDFFQGLIIDTTIAELDRFPVLTHLITRFHDLHNSVV